MAQATEEPPWPETELFPTLEDFAERRMLYDHDLSHAIDDEDLVDED
ncbi:MAG: hypothetical protein QM811_27485 [Pirellulales bacterium]